MTVWHLIMASYVSVNVGIALATASVSKAGLAGYVIALGIGIGIGVAAQKIKFFSAKLGKGTVTMMREILTDVAAEALKKFLFPNTHKK